MNIIFKPDGVFSESNCPEWVVCSTEDLEWTVAHLLRQTSQSNDRDVVSTKRRRRDESTRFRVLIDRETLEARRRCATKTDPTDRNVANVFYEDRWTPTLRGTKEEPEESRRILAAQMFWPFWTQKCFDEKVTLTFFSHETNWFRK